MILWQYIKRILLCASIITFSNCIYADAKSLCTNKQMIIIVLRNAIVLNDSFKFAVNEVGEGNRITEYNSTMRNRLEVFTEDTLTPIFEKCIKCLIASPDAMLCSELMKTIACFSNSANEGFSSGLAELYIYQPTIIEKSIWKLDTAQTDEIYRRLLHGLEIIRNEKADSLNKNFESYRYRLQQFIADLKRKSSDGCP
jgi:hypothetical protein